MKKSKKRQFYNNKKVKKLQKKRKNINEKVVSERICIITRSSSFGRDLKFQAQLQTYTNVWVLFITRSCSSPMICRGRAGWIHQRTTQPSYLSCAWRCASRSVAASTRSPSSAPGIFCDEFCYECTSGSLNKFVVLKSKLKCLKQGFKN